MGSASGGKVDAQLAKLAVVVFPVKDVPLIAAFGNGPFLGTDGLAHAGVNLGFLGLKVVEDFQDFLPDDNALFKNLHLIPRIDGAHDLVG